MKEQLVEQPIIDHLKQRVMYFSRQQASVIFDSGALHRFILENADTVCNIANAQLKAILCVVDRDLRNERLRRRSWPLTTSITVDPETTADYLQCFEHLPSDTLILYTNKPFVETFMAAKEYLLRPKST